MKKGAVAVYFILRAHKKEFAGPEELANGI